MKKIILVLAAVLLVCASAGCIAVEEEEVLPDVYIHHDQSHHHIYIYIDEHTGVEYLIYDGYESGGICPRYNADGTLKINEEFRK